MCFLETICFKKLINLDNFIDGNKGEKALGWKNQLISRFLKKISWDFIDIKLFRKSSPQICIMNN